jgi:hypothetical protein
MRSIGNTMTEFEFQIFMAKRPRQHTIRNGFFIGGVWVSVQGGYGKHSTPDTDGAYFYEWEVGYPSEEIAELLPYQTCKGIFSYVPTSVLLAIIDRLGEITERTPVQEVAP